LRKSTIENTLEIDLIEGMFRRQQSSLFIIEVIKNILDFIDSSIRNDDVNCSISFECQFMEIEKLIPVRNIAVSIGGTPASVPLFFLVVILSKFLFNFLSRFIIQIAENNLGPFRVEILNHGLANSAGTAYRQFTPQGNSLPVIMMTFPLSASNRDSSN